MPRKTAKNSSTAPPIDLDLKTRHTTGPPDHDMNRFHIFLIDTGWNTAVSKLVNVFDRKESTIAQALELMVESGELRPYVPDQSGVERGAKVGQA